MTIRELHQIAEERRLLDAQIRICDGMAVSFYPEPSCITPGRYELVIDISSSRSWSTTNSPNNV
ncbi:MAG: hypothetical protein ACLUNS_10220 [Alistipes shahii]